MNKLAIEQCATSLPEEHIIAMKKDITSFTADFLIFLRKFVSTSSYKSILDSYISFREKYEEWLTISLTFDSSMCSPDQLSEISSAQLYVSEFLSASKQLKDILPHFHSLKSS